MSQNGAYVRDAWYPAAWSRDIGRNLEARTLLEENLVVYRTEDGKVTALEDLCPHRFLPLSHGSLKGDTLQCGYHGLEFDCTGKCARVPGQDIDTGPKISVRHYPAHENLGLVWVWMGDREKAVEHLKLALDRWKNADPVFERAKKARATREEWMSPGGTLN